MMYLLAAEENGPLMALKIVLIGGALFAGVAWQCHLTFRKDKRLWVWNCNTCRSSVQWWRYHTPKRVAIPFFFGVVVFLGFLGYQIIRAIDGKVEVFRSERGQTEWVSAFWLPILKSVVFGVALVLKTYFGPLMASSCVAWSLYVYFDKNQLQLLPVLEHMLDWLFSFAPGWLEAVYVVVLATYTLSSSIYDSVVEGDASP